MKKIIFPYLKLLVGVSWLKDLDSLTSFNDAAFLFLITIILDKTNLPLIKTSTISSRNSAAFLTCVCWNWLIETKLHPILANPTQSVLKLPGGIERQDWIVHDRSTMSMFILVSKKDMLSVWMSECLRKTSPQAKRHKTSLFFTSLTIPTFITC